MLAAGHCDKGGTVVIKLPGADYTRISAFDVGRERGDIGFVALMPGVPVSASLTGIERVKGSPTTSPRMRCCARWALPPAASVGPSPTSRPARSPSERPRNGDSGGPVYSVNPDGSATAVGITSAGTLGEGTVAPPCGTPLTYAIAQLIQPWLRGSAMSILTS